jgi:hypothetical protein
VGWHWFKYSDNDPLEPGSAPSNRDANKGIVTARYKAYPALLDAMKSLNDRVYSLADYFDKIQPAKKLKKGRQVLTLHFINKPVMNFDSMEFVLVKQPF